MYKYQFNGLTRIDKRQARREYNNGNDVLFIPCKLNPMSMCGFGIWENKHLCGQHDNFDRLCDWFTWYNCTNETGKYIAFYIRKGV